MIFENVCLLATQTANIVSNQQGDRMKFKASPVD